jgi:hypothetical protein
MQKPPAFLTAPIELVHAENFRPPKLPLRGAILAWGSTGLLAIAVALRVWRTSQFDCMANALLSFFLFAAMLITLSRWIDTRTEITADLTSIAYRSPFRAVELDWSKIDEIRSIQAGHAWRVSVHSSGSAFSFRVSESSQASTSVASILALPRGAYLTQIICTMAHLGAPENQGQEWVCRRQA